MSYIRKILNQRGENIILDWVATTNDTGVISTVAALRVLAEVPGYRVQASCWANQLKLRPNTESH